MNSIGRYQLVEKLGQGGMGVVYRAYDTLLQRVVAVKVISGSIEAGPEQRERFFREARAAGQLSHRNIITIHDLGEYEGQPYLAMEFLEGEDLQRRLAGPNRMSLARKVELAIEVCEGLEYAHNRGVVHRDIKPANIFITESGTAKILDFGLARLVTSELTNSNMMMGTINYMAPEQVRGERADHRSDIFSVGVVFYELLGGRKAFEGESFAATLYKILQEVPEPLSRIDPTLPPDLVAIVERSLAKPRDERYQHMADMLRDLAVYRQQLLAYDSLPGGRPPSGGRPLSGGHGRPSDPPSVRPPSDPASDAPTIAQPTTPFPSAAGAPRTPSQGGTPLPAVAAPPASSGATAAPSASRSPIWIAGAIVLVGVTALGLWMFRSPQPPAQPTAESPAPAPIDHAAVATAMTRATDALRAGDFAEARRQADAALALDPSHAEAARLRDRAAGADENVNRWLGEARTSFEAGRYEEASRAAGNVLSIAPGHAEARRIMQDASARSRGRGADEARQRMTQARNAARAAGAPTLAAAAYNAATGAERTAQRLYDSGQLADATAKFYEASGLYRSAELSAQSAAVARAEAAKVAQERTQTPAAPPQPREPAPAPVEPPPQPPAPQPSPPIVRGAEPLPMGTSPLPSAPPKPAPAPTPAAPAEPSPENQIADVLERYKSALESQSLTALKRVWPSLGGSQESAIRNEFQHASRIEVDIASPRIDVAGASATVTFTRRYDLVTTDGQRLNSQTLTTMSFRRTPAGWVIDRVRFEPVR